MAKKSQTDMLEKMVEQQDRLIEMMTQMMGELKQIVGAQGQQIAEQSRQILGLLQAMRADRAERPFGAPPPADANSIDEAVADYLLRKEKEKNLVLCRVPEEADDDSTAAADAKLVADLRGEVGIAQSKVLRVERHGRKRQDDDGNPIPRIIKIYTDSAVTRTTWLDWLRFNESEVLPERSYARRDLTPKELEQNRQVHAKCYELNRQAGSNKFYIKGGKIYEKKLYNEAANRSGN